MFVYYNQIDRRQIFDDVDGNRIKATRADSSMTHTSIG